MSKTIWYGIKDEGPDYLQPIAAFNYDGKAFLLMPKTGESGYAVIGYDWFNLDGGTWNSNMKYETAQRAVEEYMGMGYKIRNVKISVE